MGLWQVKQSILQLRSKDPNPSMSWWTSKKSEHSGIVTVNILTGSQRQFKL